MNCNINLKQKKNNGFLVFLYYFSVKILILLHFSENLNQLKDQLKKATPGSCNTAY
jgi:hypothetical protein